MKNYLSIGEVSKIKKVSVKSLRYYGKLGILPPAYVNPETGYRYYSSDQLIIVDLISICIDFGIPLKRFKSYLTPEGSVDIGTLLNDGEQIVEEKIKQLNASFRFLEAMSQHIKRANGLKASMEERLEHFQKRCFLTVDWNGDILDYKEISAKYSQLYRQCKALDITDKFNQGVIFFNKNGQVVSKIFIEVPSPLPDVDNALYVEEGDYLCKAVKEAELLSVLEQRFVGTLIVKELFDLKLEPQAGIVEVERRAYY
ncbi:helix-turn-helix domain-containing protein [Vallitaleaceae bacterium 9-2]